VSLHPEYARRYREAWRVWIQNPEIQDAVATLGMSDIEWAQRFVEQTYGPLIFTTNTSSPTYMFDPYAAWAAAKRPVPA